MLDNLAQYIQPMMPTISFVGSAGSIAMTGYFWLVKMNRERPQLQFETVEHASRIDLGMCTAQEQILHFRLGLVVVNESTLPNAILSTSVSVMPKRQGVWCEVEGVKPVRGSTFPINLPALQSGLLQLEWDMVFPTLDSTEGMEDPSEIVDAYLRHYWNFDDRIAVEVRGLRGKAFEGLVQLKGSRMQKTIRDHLEVMAGHDNRSHG